MKVQNISGSLQTFKAGKRTYSIANNAIATVDEDIDSLADVLKGMREGRLRIVSPPATTAYAGSDAYAKFIDIDLDDVADTNSVTLGSVTFEFDANAAVTAGNVLVALGANTAAAGANLKTAINAHAALQAAGVVAAELLVTSSSLVKLIVDDPNNFISTTDSSGAGVTVSTRAAADAAGQRTTVRTFVADKTAIAVPHGLASVDGVVVSVLTSAGVVKKYDGVVTVSGRFVFLDASGSVDVANTDKVTVVAYGK